MPVFNVANWVRENSSTTGTGPLTLTGAVGNNPTFLQVFGVGVTPKVNYSIADNGVEVETGQGSYNGTTNVFTRSPLATWNGTAYSVSAPPPISLVGPVELRITLNAAQYASIVGEAASDDNYKMRRNEAWVNVPLAFSAQWAFDSVTTEADPGLGEIRLNTGAFATATELYVSHETVGGLDLNIFLEKVAVNEPILIHQSNDIDRIALYSVSAVPIPNVPMPNAVWWTIPVTFADEGIGGFLQNGKAVTVNFIGLGSGGDNLTDAVFPTYAVFNAKIVASAATVSFSSGQKQEINATTYPNITLAPPVVGKPGNFMLNILNSGSLASISTVAWEDGTPPSWAGTSLLALYYDGSTFTGTAVVNKS